MTASEMIPGTRYIVTHASVGGEFQVGDQISLLADGDILNHAEKGWMTSEDVPTATRGIAVEVDAVWAESRRAALTAQLAALKS